MELNPAAGRTPPSALLCEQSRKPPSALLCAERADAVTDGTVGELLAWSLIPQQAGHLPLLCYVSRAGNLPLLCYVSESRHHANQPPKPKTEGFGATETEGFGGSETEVFGGPEKGQNGRFRRVSEAKTAHSEGFGGPQNGGFRRPPKRIKTEALGTLKTTQTHTRTHTHTHTSTHTHKPQRDRETETERSPDAFLVHQSSPCTNPPSTKGIQVACITAQGNMPCSPILAVHESTIHQEAFNWRVLSQTSE